MSRTHFVLIGVALISLFIALWGGQRLSQSPRATQNAFGRLAADRSVARLVEAPIAPTVTYTRRELERATAHILTVPATYSIGVAVADGLSPVANIAQQIEATAALNAGFFDPQNGKTTSYITLDSNQVGDPRQNPRLMENPDLAPYLSQILNRSEFRRYYCKTEEGNVQGVDTLNEGEGMRNRETRYAIALHNASSPEGCRILDSVGGGPRLLPVLTSIDEGFVAIAGDTRIRDALGETQPNARSAVGLTATGDVLMVMAAQRPELQPSGLTLAELADLMRELGAVDALNLDGGSSTALYYQGQTYLGRWSEGQPVERPVKSALVVKE